MDTNLTERLTDLLKDAEEGFTFREILNTAAISEYAHVDIRHVLGAIAYRQQDQRWRLKTIKLPVTRNVVPKAEKLAKIKELPEPVGIEKPVKAKELKVKTVSTESVLTYLRNHPEGVTHTVLAEHLNVQKSVLAAKLKELADSKQIERFRFRIGRSQGHNQSERFFLRKYKDYVALHLQLSFAKEQAAKLGFTVTMKLEEFPDAKF